MVPQAVSIVAAIEAIKANCSLAMCSFVFLLSIFFVMAFDSCRYLSHQSCILIQSLINHTRYENCYFHDPFFKRGDMFEYNRLDGHVTPLHFSQFGQQISPKISLLLSQGMSSTHRNPAHLRYFRLWLKWEVLTLPILFAHQPTTYKWVDLIE